MYRGGCIYCLWHTQSFFDKLNIKSNMFYHNGSCQLKYILFMIYGTPNPFRLNRIFECLIRILVTGGSWHVYKALKRYKKGCQRGVDAYIVMIYVTSNPFLLN